MANAAVMLDQCFRHQHPEAYGHPMVEPAVVPEGQARAEAMPARSGDPYVEREYPTLSCEDVDDP